MYGCFTKNRRMGSVLVFSFIFMLSASAFASPVVDGRYDSSEGYTNGHYVKFAAEGSKEVIGGGELWVYQDKDNGDVTVLFSQPLALVDNTYGKNSIGWGKGVAPSGKNHNFKDLLESDKAQFVFTDSSGRVVLDVVMDYFSQVEKEPKKDPKRPPVASPFGGGDDSGSGSESGKYACLGVIGGDGEVNKGSASDVLAWGSSLDYNFNILDYVLTEDSPVTDEDYTENPLYKGWVHEVMYELKVSGKVFGKAGFGGVNIPIVHDSPNKIGGNVVYTKTDGQIPEPATLSLLAVGLVALSTRRRLV